MPTDIIGQIPLEDYFNTHIKNPKPDANGINGLCPFHDDKKRSFSVNLKTSQWNCHAGCGGGNLTSFHARTYNMSTGEAFKDLLDRYNLSTEKEKKKKKTMEKKDSVKLIDVEIVENFTQDFTPEAMKHLVEKRGWSREIIEKYRIGYIKKSKRVTIPILNENDELVNIRQYKPMAGDDDQKVFSWKKGYGQVRLWPLNILSETPKDEPIILPEGEPDCLCGLSNGLACVTKTGGVLTWKPEFNKQFSNRHVIIAYDNDDPGKKGAIKIGRTLLGEASKVEIIKWPKEFKDKEDLTDFFIKYSKTKEDFLALPRFQVEKPSSQEADTAGAEPLSVIKKDGCYWNVSQTQYSVVETKISNFTLKIIKTFYTPDGATRSVRLVSEKGRASREFEIKPEEMASKFHFAKWCFAQGNYQWKGTPANLECIRTIELEECDPRIIFRPDHIGDIDNQNMWLLGDYAIKEGKVYHPDEERIIWIKEDGFQPLSLNVDADEISGGLPLIRNDINAKTVKETRNAIVRLIKENIGGYEAYLVLGFIAACVYSREIFAHHQGFPILFISGKKEVGKNTLARIIVNHFGLEEETAKNISDITNAALTRWLAYYSCIPMWFDEYRNTTSVSKHDSILRSAYDRVGGGSRGKLGFGVVGHRTRAPVIITGEGFPKDSALASRCARIQLLLTKRKDNILKQLEQHRHLLSGIVHQLIIEKHNADFEALFSKIDALSGVLESEKIDPRLAKIYASLAVCFMQFYDPDQACDDHGDFLDWLKYQAFEVKKEKEELFILNEFFFDLESMRSENHLNGNHVEIIRNKVFGHRKGGAPEVEEDGIDIVRVWLRGIYNKWAENRRRRGEETWSYHDLLNYLKDEKYFIEPPLDNKGYMKPQVLNGKKRRCFDLRMNGLPDGVEEVFLSGWSRTEGDEDNDYPGTY